MPYIVSLVTLAVLVFALIDIITRRDDHVKFLPKMVWIIIVILLPIIGSVLWFTIGREWEGGVSLPRRSSPAQNTTTVGWNPPAAAADTRTTEQQMADLEREIEEWRLREEIAKRTQEHDQNDAN